MRTLSRPLAVVAALALVAASAAAAQRPQTRQGFWIGFGFGYGSLGFSCDGCGSDREGAVSGYLKLGGTVSPNLLIGGETNGWTKDVAGETVTAGNASLTAYYYPQPAGGLFLRGGLGFSTLKFESFDAETGFGLVLGAGYDVRVGTNTSITPVLNFNWGAPADGLKQHVIQLAVGVTFH